MLISLVIGIGIVSVTFTIHALGSTYWIEYLISHYAGKDGEWRSGTGVWCLVSTGVVLLLLHLLEALTWAAAYLWLPGNQNLKTFAESAYFSIITFTTVGYGDITLDERWHLLAGVEAVNGILLAGWSTALLFTIVQRNWYLAHPSKKKG